MKTLHRASWIHWSSLVLTCVLGCSEGKGSAKNTAGPASTSRVSEEATAASAPTAEASSRPEEPKAAPAELPADLKLRVPADVAIDGDRDLRVAHAEGSNRHALVYLHGMCGDSKGADPWTDLATERGTLVVVRADVPCGDRPGYKWPAEPEAIEARIVRALEQVKSSRNGLLDLDRVTLVGYSQGAHRAELLAARYPDKYKNLVLGGPPTAALPENLKAATRVAVLGGELENATHMKKGASDLAAAGITSRFFLLPKTGHGGYGPEGHRVMAEVFTWLWDASAAPTSAAPTRE